ncbi:permease prefix domain 1-containing protein [Blautia schinkii]|nr:permease prefix domain 1-containing protein [Blautia schinkii]
MKRDEYLKSVTEQISTPCIRDVIRRELAAHVQDQIDAFMGDGMEPDEAEAAAVQDMGDPVEVGVALDELHKPRPARKYVAAFMLLNLWLVGLNIWYMIFDDKMHISAGNIAALVIAEVFFLALYFLLTFYHSTEGTIAKHFLSIGNGGIVICAQILLRKCLLSFTDAFLTDTYCFSMMILMLLGYQGVLFHFRRKSGGWWKCQLIGLTGLFLSALASGNVWFILEGAFMYAVVYTWLFYRKWFTEQRKRILFGAWAPFGICAGIMLYRFFTEMYHHTLRVSENIPIFHKTNTPVDNTLNFNFLNDMTTKTGPLPAYVLLFLGVLFVILLISYRRHLTNEWSRLIYFTSILILSVMILNGALTMLGFLGREMAFTPFMWNLTWNYREGITLDYAQIITYYAIAGYLTRFAVRDSIIGLEIENEKIQAEQRKL